MSPRARLIMRERNRRPKRVEKREKKREREERERERGMNLVGSEEPLVG